MKPSIKETIPEWKKDIDVIASRLDKARFIIGNQRVDVISILDRVKNNLKELEYPIKEMKIKQSKKVKTKKDKK